MKKLWFYIGCLLTVGIVQPVLSGLFDSRSHKMTISGTSTLHDWEAPVNKVYAKGDVTLNNNELQSVNSMYVEAEIKSIKSAKGESMDDKIYDALDADKYYKITYNLSKVKSIEKSGSEWNVNTSGNLTISGVTQSIDMTVKAKVLPNGDVEFNGSKKIKMSNYKVDPPSAMLGMIKCGDEVTVSFAVTLKKN